MGKLVPVILLLAVTIYAIIDCIRTPADSVPTGIPKAVWVLFIVIFPGLGALAWLLVSRIARAEASGAARPGGPAGGWSPEPRRPGRRGGPTAPDDDPEFLARLEAERRRAERERRARQRRQATDGTSRADDGGRQHGAGRTDADRHEPDRSETDHHETDHHETDRGQGDRRESDRRESDRHEADRHDGGAGSDG
ncbi:PLD nuclease N-terminal domain-containing protein [Georgenia ruanii]|uniref:PLD nuclease N-terminal domain-containing protein n=1 Tax=Georgenia ruanii TaxID=348442 RepID=UPI0012653547|nr:PLD nuclease N-terminal domain-containing protein [Georgenia ruanii]